MRFGAATPPPRRTGAAGVPAAPGVAGANVRPIAGVPSPRGARAVEGQVRGLRGRDGMR
jgi:hypothetical protein